MKWIKKLDGDKENKKEVKTDLNMSYFGLFATCTKLQTQSIFFLLFVLSFFLLNVDSDETAKRNERN